MDGDTSYLEKDFDPHTLKVNQLKKIFISHDIYFPTSAKKAQLIEIFEQEVTPNSKKFLKQLKVDSAAAVKPIEDATSAFDENQESNKNHKPKHNKKSTSSSKNNSATPESGKSVKKENNSKEDEKKMFLKSSDPSDRSIQKQSDDSENDDSTKLINNSVQNQKKKSKKRSSSAMEQDDSNASRSTRSRSANSASTKKRSKTTPSSAGNFFDLSGSDMDTSEDFEKLISNNLKDSAQILKSPQRSLKRNLKDILGSNTKKKNHLSRTPVKEKAKVQEVKDTIPNSPNGNKALYQSSEILDSDELAKQLGITIQGKKPKKSFDPSKDSIIFSDEEEKQQLPNDLIAESQLESSPTKAKKSSYESSLKQSLKNHSDENSDRAKHAIGQSMISKAAAFSKENEQLNEPTENFGKIAKIIPLEHDDDNNVDDIGLVEPVVYDDVSKVEVPSSQVSHEQFSSSINQPVLSDGLDSNNVNSRETDVERDTKNEDEINTKEQNEINVEEDKDEVNVEENEDEVNIKKEEDYTEMTYVATSHSFFSYLKSFFVFGLIILSFIFSYWYLQKGIYVGYCGYSVNNFNILPNPNNNQYITEVEHLLSKYASPKCIECPANAICHPFFDITCQEGFLKVKPFNYWISGKKCIPDIRRKRRIETMTHVALNILRQRNTNFDCGKGTDLQVGLPLEDIHDILFETRSLDVSVEEFEEIWNKVKDRIEATDDIVTFFSEVSNSKSETIDENLENKVQKKCFRSTSLKYLNPYCRTKAIIHALVIKYRKQVLLSILTIILLNYIYIRVMKAIQRKKEKQRIAEIIIERLRNQKSLAEQDRSGKIHSFLDNIVLRDQLLSNDKRTKNRKWESITKLVESNTFVRTQKSEIYGDIRKTWEWTAD